MDKPLTVATPSRTGDADRDTPAGVTASPAKKVSQNGSDKESSTLPKDATAVSSQEDSPRVGSSADGKETPDGGRPAAGGSADEDLSLAVLNGSASPAGKPAAPLPADIIKTGDGRSKDDSGQNGERLLAVNSARQAVKQAVAATNNWFTGRAAKVAGDQSAAPAAPSPAASAAASTDGAALPATGAAQTSTTTPSGIAPPTARPPSGRPYASPAAPPSAPPSSGARPPRYTQPGATGLTAAPRRRRAPRRAPRQAQLTVARIEPWSVMKFSALVSVVAFIVIFVAVAVLYAVLSGLGVFDSLQHFVTTVTSSKGNVGTNIKGWFSAARILGYTGILGSINIVLITAMATIGAVVYNLISRTIGGIEVTLRETD